MALSHVGQSFDQHEYSAETAGLGLLRILEIVRTIKLDTRIYQASTSELFGSTPPPQSETSLFNPQSPYAAAKRYAYDMARIYREAFGIFISTGILFNHESPRRSRTFVTRKISAGVADTAGAFFQWLKDGSGQIGSAAVAPFPNTNTMQASIPGTV